MTLLDASANRALAARLERRGAEVDARPGSVVPIADGLLGLAALVAVWIGVVWVRPPLLVAAWLLLLATALPMLGRELARHRPVVRPAGGTALRPLAWLAGFLLATAPFVMVHGQHAGLLAWGIVWVVVAPAFIIRLALEARRNGGVGAGFPVELGGALISRDPARIGALAAPARLWALKALFIPLYALSLIAMLRLTYANPLSGPAGWLGLAVTFAYTIDLCFGLSGYLMASNGLVPTIRSTQKRLLGWVVCVVCYGPVIVHLPDFEAVLSREVTWPDVPNGAPLVLLGTIAMLALLVLFVSATVSFGLRFCNLSNRGLISHGPYRWMKHPAYFAHAGNAWIITFIFMPAAGIALGPAQILVPVVLTVIYWLRSVTEEQHMREDPDYVAYADWIERHGLLARLLRLVRRNR